jgi:hypothetical protein
MLRNREFLAQLQRFTASAMITPSALRNVGAPGVVHCAQDFSRLFLCKSWQV